MRIFPFVIPCILCLTVCLIWSSVILTVCTFLGTRDLYPVSFRYNTNSEFDQSMVQFYDTVNRVKNQVSGAKHKVNGAKDKVGTTMY